MARMASPGGMLPEQVWDAAPIPLRGLAPGQATGSAMPLAWTHAEYLKLVASRALRRPFDRPESVWRRYGGVRSAPKRAIWCEHAAVDAIRAGMSLIVVLDRPAIVHYGFDGWQRIADAATTANSLGVHVLRLDTARLLPGARVDFTFRYSARDRWIGTDYHIEIKSAD